MNLELKMVTNKGGRYSITVVENNPTSSKWVVAELPWSQDGDSWSELKTAVKMRLQDHYGVLPISIKMGYDKATGTWPVTVTILQKAVYQIYKGILGTNKVTLIHRIEADPEQIGTLTTEYFKGLVCQAMEVPDHRLEYTLYHLKVMWNGGGVYYYTTRL